MANEKIGKLKAYLQSLIIKKPGEHYSLQEIAALLATIAGIGGGLGMLGGPMGSGIGTGVGLAVGAGIIITVELVNKYRLYKMSQQTEEEYYVIYKNDNNEHQDQPELAHSNNNSLKLDDTDTQSSEESISNDNNKKAPHKSLRLERARESLAKLTSKLGLHKSKDSLLDGLTQEENILKPIKLGKG